MVHSSVCRAPATVAVIVLVGCCIVRVGGRWFVVAGAVVVAIVFTIAIAGVVFAIVLAGVVVLARVGVRCRGSRRCVDRLHRRCCGVVFAILLVEVRGSSSSRKLLSSRESGVVVA